MVMAGDANNPLDIQIDDIEFTDYTPQEKDRLIQRARQREAWIAQSKALLGKLRGQLDKLGRELDARAAQGKFVDVARVYWAVLGWCADDAQRLLEAEEYELVERAPMLLADLGKAALRAAMRVGPRARPGDGRQRRA